MTVKVEKNYRHENNLSVSLFCFLIGEYAVQCHAHCKWQPKNEKNTTSAHARILSANACVRSANEGLHMPNEWLF